MKPDLTKETKSDSGGTMPQNDLVVFRVLQPDDGVVTDAETERTAVTWADALAALWSVPPPRAITAADGGQLFIISSGEHLGLQTRGSTADGPRQEIFTLAAETQLLAPPLGLRWAECSVSDGFEKQPFDMCILSARAGYNSPSPAQHVGVFFATATGGRPVTSLARDSPGSSQREPRRRCGRR